jgi:hypothetical protein
MKANILREVDLEQFTGSENWYRHSLFRQFLYTDGVQYAAEKGGAYWLIDKILACQSCVRALAREPMCCWKLTLNDEGQGQGSFAQMETTIRYIPKTSSLQTFR